MRVFFFCSRGDRRSQLPISGPSDFVHVIHMGPGNVVGLQNLIELRSPNSNTSTGASSSGSQTATGGVGPVDKVCFCLFFQKIIHLKICVNAASFIFFSQI